MHDDYKKTIRNTSVLNDRNASAVVERTMRADMATIRPNATQPSATVRTQATRQGSGTIRPDAAKPAETENTVNDFVLKGKHYENVRCLSSNSGEAQVYLVRKDGKDYALKLFYAGVKQNREMAKKLVNLSFEMIVKYFDFGFTYVDGEQRDYELMEFMYGGTLEDIRIMQDINRFRRIALQAAASLAFIHNDNIIHKDVKPENFFFRDKEHTQLALGDFGISSILEDDGQPHRTTQARTPLYAAPEMYVDVIDGEVEITPKADFYSLGITLMTLWLGENPFGSNERMMTRQKNEGRLPRIDELPERVKMVVMGLTTVNPETRWGFKEVERWFQGESPKVDIASPFLRYKKFVFDPERNLIASNAEQLAALMVDNAQLGRRYLYTHTVSKWLDECGNGKLSTEISNIVNNRYPANQDAGMLSAIYTLAPTYPYRDLHGNRCTDIHSVAISMLSYIEEYAVSLTRPDNSLFLYLESHTNCDIHRIREYFAKANGDKEKGRLAVLRTVFETDADVPFLSRFGANTVKDIVAAFGTGTCTDDEWNSLIDGRLESWMYTHCDEMAQESLRILQSMNDGSRGFAYITLYNIDRESAFDLRHADTPEKVGHLLSEQLMEWQSVSDEKFAQLISDYSNLSGRLAFYAQLHGWAECAESQRSCFDMQSKENKERLGAYDLRTAAYRFCKMIGGNPCYRLDDGTLLSNPSEANNRMRSKVLHEIKEGSFSQWLTLFHHENPDEDFAEPYSYEQSLVKWLEEVGNFDPSFKYFKRFTAARATTAAKIKATKKRWAKVKSTELAWSYVCYALAILWIVLVIFVGIHSKQELFYNRFLYMVLPLGVGSAIVAGTRAYFQGYNFTLSLLLAMLGFLSAFIPAFILINVNTVWPKMFTPCLVVLSLIYLAICRFTSVKTDSGDAKRLVDEALDDDVKTEIMEPLYYTFKSKSYTYKGSKFGVLDEITDHVDSMAGESSVHFITWSVLFGILVAEICIANFM